MNKMFSVAGVASLNGSSKFKVANGTAAARTRALSRAGFAEIQLFDLAKPMTKEAAYAYLAAKGLTESKKSAAKSTKSTKTVKLTSIVKKVSKKFVAAKATKEVPAEQILEEIGIVVTGNGAPSTKSIEEMAKIKTKNLETMRRVSNKLAALRNYN